MPTIFQHFYKTTVIPFNRPNHNHCSSGSHNSLTIFEMCDFLNIKSKKINGLTSKPCYQSYDSYSLLIYIYRLIKIKTKFDLFNRSNRDQPRGPRPSLDPNFFFLIYSYYIFHFCSWASLLKP